MDGIYANEDCLNYDQSDKPQMDIIRLRKGEAGCITTECHVMYFFLEGNVRFSSRDFPDCEVSRLQVIFLPAEGYYSYETLRDTEIIIVRLLDTVKLCKNLRIETLDSIRYSGVGKNGKTVENEKLKTLNIHPALQDFLRSVCRSLVDGISCQRYFELSIESLFIQLRCYYSKDELYNFLYMILSEDVVFSEYIRQRWMNFRSVKELAASMHLSSNHFTRKFTHIFGQSPYKWMESARAKIVYKELVYTEKNLKQVAFENGFSSMSMFTQFIKRELGKTPLEIRMGLSDNQADKKWFKSTIV